VLLLDKATFPSDTLSSHFIRLPGLTHLKHWGILDAVIASNCPPISTFTFDAGPFSLSGMAPPVEGVAVNYAPRRLVLDKILVDAAVAAGVEFREGFSVQQLMMDQDRVRGIEGRGPGGQNVKEQAHLVIGADGMRSLVARAVQAPTFYTKPSLSCSYYTYWSGVPIEGVEIYSRPSRLIITFPTNDGLTCTYVSWPQAEFHTFRADIEGNFLQTLDLVPSLAERVRQGKREARFAGTGDAPNFFRKPFGPGWVLVGDAGCHEDPYLAQGITNAFHDAALVPEAIDAGFCGRQSLETALSNYERQRNETRLPLYELNAQLASLEPPPPEIQHLLAALQGNQTETNRFFGALDGSVAVADFFAPDKVTRIIAESHSVVV
jgi:2-polyprenyl-6-methoxyphenol hydroxylase-like FAD-dependent oxidoreductase